MPVVEYKILCKDKESQKWNLYSRAKSLATAYHLLDEAEATGRYDASMINEKREENIVARYF